ncbi:AI-2E family transporter [Corynebacterium sanguinis]|uniref:AI-2E family transporter n=1 Tax=Corynebacterium sanguinis TaxID=2594913 RepID=UPI00223A9226|nr:AI-2E family transporter [Corynebacterium sanguinis]MCT1443672.1 AI-2E family transporter [Corynebacterium sanguinis]MCT1498802.1 AI-2E family transporter [Corynebacterium sanguinis]MCT1596926.1 AI-2E family transporter [Corynebacterium sanguinis]MCT1628050.1 AI-2E family transporter [Corynebacterium sanguinis]
MYPTPADAAQELSGQEIDRGDVIAADGRAAAAWALRFIIIVAATALLFYLLRYVWFGLLPILLGLIISTVLWPPVRALRRVGLPSALAVLVVLVLSFAIIGGIIAAMAPIVRDQGGALIVQAQAGFNELLRLTEENLQFIEAERVQEGVAQFTEFMRGQASTIASGVFSGLGAVASVGTTLVLTLILTFFFLKDGDQFLPFVRKYAGVRAGWHLTEVLMRSWNTLAGFIRTQAIVSAVDAVFIGIGLILLGVPLWPVLAVITFFAGFIPIIGAFTAGALAVVVALVSNGFTNAILVLLLVVAVQQIEGNVLQPILQSRAMGLHAAVVLLSVALGGTLFGIIGAFLAVPVAAVAAVFLGYWAEMVSLRAGHISADDIKIATQQSQTLDSKEAFLAVRERMRTLARPGFSKKDKKATKSGSTRIPSDKKVPSKKYDRQVPGKSRATEPVDKDSEK